ncbi:MGH1-like glycoside hydrolase domain-containing protein [Jannaschia formosa]|uniref:MGH1-like glycoside hydrolase domain-containing protein n=1 Tax=Jannaschia formosa TaxID=2259592 RepID=UPI000E1BFADD|nr:hypothetical protein [Jannaschia formosa]TFL17824.1 hypothetical protein DR046_13075 [Jannaschia formosa]
MVTDLDARARAILTGNDRGGYTVPTAGLYPFQWNWDSAFAAWGFSTFDPDRAWTELETLLAHQWPDGMVPHIVFHRDDRGYFPGPDVWDTGRPVPTSGITQPPVAATMARMILAADPGQAGRAAALVPKLAAWHRWWMRARVREGVACVVHPWESGRDNAFDWDGGMANVDGSEVGTYQRRDTGHVDASMRPTKAEYDRYLALVQWGRAHGWDQVRMADEGPLLVADPGTCFILIRACDDLAALAAAAGVSDEGAGDMAHELRAGLGGIWNAEAGFWDARDLRTGAFSGILSAGAWLCWLAGAGRPEMASHLARAMDNVRYALPTVDPTLPTFEARRYWRGPAWPFYNALAALGLRDAGLGAEAERLRADTEALIRGGGFYEYFDPTDGTPCGGKDFTWTAAIWLTWAGRGA